MQTAPKSPTFPAKKKFSMNPPTNALCYIRAATEAGALEENEAARTTSSNNSLPPIDAPYINIPLIIEHPPIHKTS
jgi:hypothetical protein